MNPQELYGHLNRTSFRTYPFSHSDRGEGITVVEQVIGEYWKPRYIMDNVTKCAYEFMTANLTLLTISDDDIDWTGIPHDVLHIVRSRNAYYPTRIYGYSDGVASVDWTLHPDGRYYMDEDGFGMEDDEEISLSGKIDRTGTVVEKFHISQ